MAGCLSLPGRAPARRAGWLPWADAQASCRSGADIRVGRRLALAPGRRLAGRSAIIVAVALAVYVALFYLVLPLVLDR